MRYATPVNIVCIRLNSDVLVQNKTRKRILRCRIPGCPSFGGIDIGKPDSGMTTRCFKGIPIDNVGNVFHNCFLLVDELGMTNSLFSSRAQLHGPDTVSGPYM